MLFTRLWSYGRINFRYVIDLNHFFGGREQVFVILTDGNWVFITHGIKGNKNMTVDNAAHV